MYEKIIFQFYWRLDETYMSLRDMWVYICASWSNVYYFLSYPSIHEKEFIIEVDDEVTLKYIIGFTRREFKVIKFYVVWQPVRW